MKAFLLLLALVVCAFAQDALDAVDALDVSLDLDEDDIMLDAAVADDQIELELEDANEEVLAAADDALLKRSLEEAEEDEALTAEEDELLREVEFNLENVVEEDSLKRQATTAERRFTPRAPRNLTRMDGAWSVQRFNASSALRHQIGSNQRQRRALHGTQLQSIRNLRQKWANDRQTLLDQQSTTRRALLQNQRNETTTLLQTQRTERRKLYQQQTALLANTTQESQRIILRVQLRQARELLRTQQKQARQTLQETHTKQRQALHRNLRKAREDLSQLQSRDRVNLATKQSAERRALRTRLRASNGALRQRIRNYLQARHLRLIGARLANMARALVQINVTGLSANTTQHINVVGRILSRLRAISNRGNMTRFRGAVRNATGPVLLRLRQLSLTPELAGTTSRRHIGTIIRGIRSLREITPYHQMFGRCLSSGRHSSSPRTYTRGSGSARTGINRVMPSVVTESTSTLPALTN